MTKRHPEVLVAPGVTFLAVVALVAIARFYDQIPVQPSPCNFRTSFGIPCIACGGTRAFKALSQGHIREAFTLNPAVIIGVAAAFAWFVVGLTRFYRGKDLKTGREKRISAKKITLLLILLLGLNWIYLILFLP